MSIGLSIRAWFFTSPSNEALMQRYSDTGEQLLLEKLYEACAQDLYHFVLTLSDPTLAKDICQQTWLKVMEKKHLYRDSGKFKAWLFTLARNLLIDEYRLRKVQHGDIDELSAPEPLINHDKLLQRFDQALLALPFAQREAFCLQQEDFCLHDIASITHSNVEAVKSRLRYAKDNLRQLLRGDFETDHD
jgi:RNA polymerase sigma factor (sigma-70 family)